MKISKVERGSVADELGIVAGDQLVGFNDGDSVDLIDYIYYNAQEEFVMSILHGDELVDYLIEKDSDEDLGLELVDQTPPKACRNKCIFCFIDQLPRDKSLRKTLRVKDDDYRLSNLFGNYVTLTNMTERDYQRIIDYKLSPLYVSVHSTDDSIRRLMLGNPKAAPIMPALKRLSQAGITIHAQIVYCPGYNDDYVMSTMQLASVAESLAIVPVGLTKFFNTKLKPVSPEQARKMVLDISELQTQYLAERDSRFVFLADEIYLRAGLPLPSYSEYQDFEQIDNGVGLMADFEARTMEALESAVKPKNPRSVAVVTGFAAFEFIKSLCDRISVALGVPIEVFKVRNDFFGEMVNVAGLVTGGDIASQLGGKINAERVLIPRVMLKADEAVFLDGMTVDQLAEQLCKSVCAVWVDGEEFVRQIVGEYYE